MLNDLFAYPAAVNRIMANTIKANNKIRIPCFFLVFFTVVSFEFRYLFSISYAYQENPSRVLAPLFFWPPAQYIYPMRWLLTILFVMVLALSCASKRPLVIPEDLTPMELIQRGQEASDRNRYSSALQYYDTLIERFPQDIDFICAAEYEIAFIHYKQKKYDSARLLFNNLLERYNTPDAELLPPQFKILSEKVLERITEIENSRRRRRK